MDEVIVWAITLIRGSGYELCRVSGIFSFIAIFKSKINPNSCPIISK
jgi:hypothetical protein